MKNDRRRLVTLALLAMGFGILWSVTASAQTTVPNGAMVIEWNVPDVEGASLGIGPHSLVINDVTAGATGPVWYMTQASGRLVRFTTGQPVETDAAIFASWDLGCFFDFCSVITNYGLKIAPGQVAFTHGDFGTQRIDTLTNVRILYNDSNGSRSDVGIDPNNWVYTTDPSGFVQRLAPIDSASTCAAVGLTVPCAQLTRWFVGGNPGLAELAGVAVHPGTGKLVYFSDTYARQIGELDPVANTVRYFPVGTEPGQLIVDRGGAVYAVANVGATLGSLVKLEPKKNQLTTYSTAGTAASMLVGLGAQGAVGFTETDRNTIGMLVSGGVPAPVSPSTPADAPVETTYVQGNFMDPGFNAGSALPVATPADVLVSGSSATGVFEEVFLPNLDLALKGIARDPGPLGTFYYAVNGFGTDNRIGRVRMSIQLAKFVTGSGSFPVAAGAATFNFTASQYDALSPVTGQFSYYNPATGDDVESLALTGLTILGQTATIAGTCTNNGLPCTFTANVADNLLLGTADTFSITPVLGTPVAAAVSEGSIRIKQ